jgi:hypothetical protein
MSTIPSIGGAGLGLLDRAEARLERSAQAFTQTAATDDTASNAPADGAPPEDLIDAAIGTIYARTELRLGVTLIEVGRDAEKRLLDVLA